MGLFVQHSPARRLFWLLLLLVLHSVLAADDNDKFIKRNSFDSQITSFQFFDDSETVLVTEPRKGIVHISKDAGASWDDVDKIKTAVAIFLSPNDNKVAIVMCTGDKHWITRDQGKSWSSFRTEGMAPSPGSPFSFHASDNKKIIVNARNTGKRVSFYTTDGFKSDPKKLKDSAQQCMWAKEKVPFTSNDEDIDSNRILCIAPPDSQRGIVGMLNERLVYSDNYFKDENEVQIGDGRAGSGFVSMVSAAKYIMAAKRAEHTMEMAMYTTTDGSEWHRALFGQKQIDADGYTVMESTNYSIRVDVMEGGGGPFNPAPMGTLFSSDSNGTYFTSMQGYTNRNGFGFVDYERLDNIQGVALANIVANPDAVLERNQPKQLQTMITFDDGRSFNHLRGRRDDRKGELHLHGYSEMLNQGKVYSNKGAPGLLMGIGNLGEDLHDYQEGNLWISSNGGEDWYFGYEGPHKYEFADSGSVLVAISDTVPTDHVKYSLDYGRKWTSLKLPTEGDEKLNAGIFTTITDSTSKKVLLTATSGRGDDAKLWVYSIDFELLDLAKCKKGDYEIWNAREEDDKAGCVMGHTQSFRRKKPDSECSVDQEFDEAVPESEDCPCAQVDFECDTGYVRSEDGKKCLPEKDLAIPKGKCKKGDDTFMSRSGFRQIPGNTCKKNDKYEELMEDVERSCNDFNKTPTAEGITSEITRWDQPFTPNYRYLERPSSIDDDDDDYSDKDETLLLLTADREAWKTHNHGKTWEHIKEIEGALFIYPNPHEHRDAYIITASREVYYTTDRGRSFRKFDAPKPPNDQNIPILRFHQTRRDWLIWTGCESNSGPCNPTAHRSLKRGDDWIKLVNDAGSCEFVWQEGRNTSEKLVFCAQNDDHRKSLISSDDWFDENTNKVFDDIVNFATMSEFIVVATHGVDGQTSLALNASVDAQTFAPAKFPPKMSVTPYDGFDGYTVLDSSSHSIFLHATINGRRDREFGTIVKSNSNGTSFVTSLVNVNRNTDGFVDFEKVQAIEGTALANVVSNVDEVDNDGAPKIRQTKITHNDGADWDFLDPPEEDNEGNKYDCATQMHPRKEKCALHLHGYTERRTPDDAFSSPSAAGLVMGIGNVGSELGKKRDGDTFVSRDGGITWNTAAKGQYMWEFGDQGSIIVLVEERAPTSTILYSLDEGRHFTEYRFAKDSEEYEILDLSTVPSDGSLNFLLWGREPNGKRQAVTINIDFRGAFDRKCNFKEGDHDEDDSDYELWEPKHPHQEDGCLFGHRAQYHRKKAESTDCYNGPRIERFHKSLENCSCTARDFECDYNYQRNTAGVCVKVGEERDPIQACYDDPDLEEYYPISGYRRIPGDTCQGGQEAEKIYSPKPCPRHEKEFYKKHGTSAWLVLFIVLICAAGAGGIGYFVYHRFATGQFGRIHLGDGDASQTMSRMRIPLPNLDTNSPLVRYPVMAVSGVAAALMAVPMIVVGGPRWLREKFPGGRRGGYSRLGGEGPAWRGGAGSRTYRSRDSFARGRDWTGQASDESDLLGEESDEEA